MTRTFRRVLLPLALLAACSPRHGVLPARSGSPQPVALVVVDGLDAKDLIDDDMPWLARAWRTGTWCPNARAVAAMPARTNVNHATLTTGVEPEVHGVTGNAFWERTTASPRKLGAGADLLTQTLFTEAQAQMPPLRTAAAVGKAKLQLMFAPVRDRQSAPSATWSPNDASASERDSVTGYAFDAATLAGARRMLSARPAFLLVNLADVDRVSHATGPRSAAARATRTATDRALAAFVQETLARPEWRQGTIVITADHGFDTTTHPSIDMNARLRAAGLAPALVSVADGGVAHVYVRDRSTPTTPSLLAAARRLARATPGVAEALYLVANPLDGGDAAVLARVHPDWHVAHERVGDLLVIAAPGYALAEPEQEESRLLGNHGAPGEREVPIVVVGASRHATDECGSPRAADLGATVLWCLGLPAVARLDGGPVAAAARGRVLAGLCARGGGAGS